MTSAPLVQRAWHWPKGKELLLAAVALFVTLCAVYSFSIDIRATRGASITGDEPFYLLTTQSLLADGNFDLTNQYVTRSYKTFFDHSDDLWRQSLPKPDDGSLLSPHNPGLSILVIPGFSLGGLLGAQIQLLVLGAATMAMAFVLADRLTGRRVTSWMAALCVGLTATAFIYSTEVYPEFPAALALVLALLVVTREKSLGVAQALLLTALLSIMCWLGVKYAFLALPVAGYYMLRAEGRGRLALLMTGIASAAFYAWFHLELYGGLTPYGVNAIYAQRNTAEILGGHIEWGERYYRLWGLFIDRRFGIGRWAPLLLVAVPGMALLAAGRPALKLALSLVLVQMLVATFVAITMMGWWFPGRTMLTVLPLFVLPIVLVISKASLWGRIVVAVLAALTLATTYGLALAGRSKEITIAVDPFDMTFPAFQGLSGVFPLYTWWTVETWWLTWLWLTLAGLTTGAIAWPEIGAAYRRLRLSRGAVKFLGMLALLESLGFPRRSQLHRGGTEAGNGND